MWQLLTNEKPAKARKIAEKFLKTHPNAFEMRFALGWIHHYAEVNFAMALFHETRALEEFEKRFGKDGGNESLFLAEMLRELQQTYYDLERFEDQLATVARYNASYTPRIVAEQAWPLMKMRRFDEAREMAKKGFLEGTLIQQAYAHNAQCAIEFEAGDEKKSYQRCEAALNFSRQLGAVYTVDLSNFAESSRSLFKFDEAERLLLEATEKNVSWYANPWLELSELYMRQARIMESLDALKMVPNYRAARPTRVRNSDQAEHWRGLASFFLLVNRPREALAVTERAMRFPDRRAHNSRDPYQDRVVMSLLHREAKIAEARQLSVDVATKPWYQRLCAKPKIWLTRIEAWMSGRKAYQLIPKPDDLAKFLRIGSAKSAITPAWLAPDIFHIAGYQVSTDAIDASEKKEKRPKAAGYSDAYRCENHAMAGNEEKAISFCKKALGSLPPAEKILRNRVRLRLAQTYEEQNKYSIARQSYEEVMMKDPTAFVRLDQSLPLRVEAKGDTAEEVGDAIEGCAGINDSDNGFVLRIGGSKKNINYRLLSERVTFVDRNIPRKKDETFDDFLARATHEMYASIFSPRIDLSQQKIGGLDGSNAVQRNDFGVLFEEDS